MLPKSLHTVRILAAVARHIAQTEGRAVDPRRDCFAAAAIIGYGDADPTDTLVHKAAAQLAKGGAVGPSDADVRKACAQLKRELESPEMAAALRVRS